MKLLADDGYLPTFSCSHHVNATLFREMLESAAPDARRPMRWVETRGQARDHPEILQIPESVYLMVAACRPRVIAAGVRSRHGRRSRLDRSADPPGRTSSG